MPRKTTKTVKAVAPETKTEVAVEESDARKVFRKFMEDYKEQNPEKFARKEAGFNKKLNSL